MPRWAAIENIAIISAIAAIFICTGSPWAFILMLALNIPRSRPDA